MRNWNSDRRILRNPHLLLPDYLWGIETSSNAAHASIAWESSQTTYEELKPVKFWIFGCYMESSQTTYEELKPYAFSRGNKIVALPDYLWGIETDDESAASEEIVSSQTTYEELKHPTAFGAVSWRYKAPRLPMRNWNFQELTFRLLKV